ncbi:MAG TPA: hemolysin III family protein [Acidiferrobacter sp.]|nr:hemolysin III family protein [Acidiferrobacter sp.]
MSNWCWDAILKTPGGPIQYHERFNSLSHIIGGVLAIIGAVVLIVFAALDADPWRIVSFSVYGLSLIFLYAASGLYHGLSGRARHVFQRLDHIAIYVLIAGTYTPFTLGPLRGVLGWWLFGILWGLAVLGIIQEFIPQRTRRVSVVLYIVMGWLIVLAIGPLARHLAPWGLVWLVVGGLFYTIGVIFFVFDEKWRYGHEIWHIFVLAGSISQYCAVLFYIGLAPVRIT